MVKKYYDKKNAHGTPIQVDYARVVKYDDEGAELISYEKVDYKKIQESHGKVGDWSLNALLKAGIDPSFPIHTSFSTRLEGLDTVNTAASEIIEYLDSISEDNNTK